jgi:hypothetical protein
VTLRGTYAAGVLAVAAAGLVVVTTVPASIRFGVLWGLVVGLLLQSPLGWWALRTVGTERFLMVWGVGMLVRFAVVAVAAFVLLAAPGPMTAPMLVTMVSTLVALLLLEGAVAMREHSRDDER